MKRALTMALLATLGSAPRAIAQQQVQQNPERLATYVEFGGNGILTINGEARIADGVSMRLDGMFVPLPTDDRVPASGVAMVNKLVGRNGQYLELGAGVTRSVGSAQRTIARLEWAYGPTTGYRREAHYRVLRVTFAPVFDHSKKNARHDDAKQSR